MGTSAIAHTLILLLALVYHSCHIKKGFQYHYDDRIPDAIEEVFIGQYSKGLERYEWKLENNKFEVHFKYLNDYKIASYDSTALLTQMQTEVILNDQLQNEFKKEINNKNIEILNCFLVVKKDSIYHRINYKDKNTNYNHYLIIPDIPEL